ncbi:hypothetical protein RPMA_17030 [Tardiphaga alba]|uniref:DUF7662 domain-containing protein n=1 Tax=Tardiphaga alba TaxID=340268 RepID=A0ABX8ADF8_9BRAD|nr:hypothetical protein [Tardiphaga alba]QUS40350.1 hypothetical protein RPMA_17030 [Tardiphaga alba]
MTKYAALGDFLSRQPVARVQLSFADIERITGGKLPASQRYPAWWSNNPMNNPMTRVWLDAGFRTEQVDIAGRKLVFYKADTSSTEMADANSAAQNASSADEHPLVTRLRGTVRVAPGVDLTAPADNAWGDLAYGDGGSE